MRLILRPAPYFGDWRVYGRHLTHARLLAACPTQIAAMAALRLLGGHS